MNRSCVKSKTAWYLGRQLGVAAMLLVVCASVGSAQRTRPGPVTLQEVVDIGCGSCGDFRLLNNVLGVTLAQGDSVYVLDAMRPKVRVFRRNGRRITSFISEGREPGQVVLPVGMVLSDTTSTLVDGVLGRVTAYRRDWTYLSHYQLAATPIAVAHRPPHAHFFVATVDYRSGAPIIQIWRAQAPDSTVTLVQTLTDGFPRNRRGETTSFFAFAMTPAGGFAVGEGAFAYLIRMYDQNGNHVSDIARDVDRTEMTQAEQGRALERRAIAMRRASSLARANGGNPGTLEDVSLEKNYFSAPALRFDDWDRLWVKTDRGGERETVFDVFETSGDLYTEVRAPVAIGLYDVRGGHLAGLTLYPMEVPVVKMFRINERRRR